MSWVADANGSHVRRVTDAEAQEFDPTWSPDGSRVAYRHQTEGDDTTEIFVMDADGSHSRRLTHNHVADWGPDWSTDGRSIVWNSAVGTGGFGLVGATMRPDGSNVHRLTRHYVEYPAWSPDGTKIAFMAQEPGASGNNPDYNIFVMDANGSNIHRLTTTPGEDGWPAWSPDGSQIVFASARDDCAISDAPDCRTTGDVGPWEDVWIANADGSNQHRATPEFGQFFAWAPDGRAILVAGASSMFVIRPNGSGRVDIPIHDVGQRWGGHVFLIVGREHQLSHHSTSNYIAMFIGQRRLARVERVDAGALLPGGCRSSRDGNSCRVTHNPVVYHADIDGLGGVWSADAAWTLWNIWN